jgi:hypothetical protein
MSAILVFLTKKPKLLKQNKKLLTALPQLLRHSPFQKHQTILPEVLRYFIEDTMGEDQDSE